MTLSLAARYADFAPGTTREAVEKLVTNPAA